MALFEIQARSDRSGVHRRSKWLIVGDSLFDALWRIPDEVTIEAVDVRAIPARTRGETGRTGNHESRWLGTRRHEHAVACAPMTLGSWIWICLAPSKIGEKPGSSRLCGTS